MKYAHIITGITFSLISFQAFAHNEYTTGCSYVVAGDRTTYKYRSINEPAVSYTSPIAITPKACVDKATAAVKQTYTTQFLSGGKFNSTSYRNKVVTIQIEHKDNVDFPQQQLESLIARDSCLKLKNSFELIDSWFGENFVQAKIANVDCNASN